MAGLHLACRLLPHSHATAGTLHSHTPACLPSPLAALPAAQTLLPLPPAVHRNIAFLGSGLLVANYVGAIAAALRFPAMFNIWTMGGGHALLAVSTDSRVE